MKTPYWSTKDYVFAGMTSIALFLVASVVIPVTLPLRIPGLANTINAFFASIFMVIALIKLQKPGSILLITGIYSLICLIAASPIVFGFVLAGGTIAELICFILFRGYRGLLAPVVGTVIYEMAMFPFAMLLSFFFLPERYGKIAPWIFAVAELAIFTTSTLGSLIGLKLALELAKAGKLNLSKVKPYDVINGK